MKIANLVSILALICTIVILVSCSGFEGAQIQERSGGKTHPMRRNYSQRVEYSHHPNSAKYPGASSGPSFSFIRLGYFPN
jgi:hypothetical protein